MTLRGEDHAKLCRELWIAVLAQAYKDLEYKANDRNEQCRVGNTEKVRFQAQRFLRGTSADFHAVCYLAGVEPDRAKKFAVKKTAEYL